MLDDLRAGRMLDTAYQLLIPGILAWLQVFQHLALSKLAKTV